ncbi:hypothetical protein BJX64DRAFT_276047 [Aspergillus heterothallicus]
MLLDSAGEGRHLDLPSRVSDGLTHYKDSNTSQLGSSEDPAVTMARKQMVVSLSDTSGSSTGAVFIPATSVDSELAGTPKSQMALMLENLDLFVAVGVLEKSTAYPEMDIARLKKENWIRTTTHQDKEHPHLSYVRIYVLPFDIGQTFMDRHINSTRKALRAVMSLVDPSPGAWNGGIRSGDRIKAITLERAEEESLWYIFNTLENPAPTVETIRDAHAKHAMCDLLSIPTANELQDDNGQAYTGILGLKTALYPYQRRSAATMIQREVQPHQMLDPRLQACTSPTGQEYYYDRETGRLVREKVLYSEASGGILAETMGCGKTLICLAVILATIGHFPQIPLEYQTMQTPVRDSTGSLLNMAAAAAGRLSLPWKGHFDSLRKIGEYYDECVKACEAHRGAYMIPQPPGRHTGRSGVEYPRLAEVYLRLCSATLIIVPPNLLDHWVGEIGTHTEGLNVLVMRGNADTVPAVEDLLTFDIVLFSRTRFDREADDFSDEGWDRPKEISPLRKVHWLRVIVDEGHNVAGHRHRTVMMHLLDQLCIERRWVVSGTPSSGLYGVEVSLASQETHTDSADLTQATTAVLRRRKKTGKAVDHELRDLDKLRDIVVGFLRVKPWANSSNDSAKWSTYIKPYGNDGKRQKSPSLRATLQSLVVRHRLDVIHSEIPLPRLHNKVVHLEPTFHDKLSLNLFIFLLAVNAITSERQDQDYMFHPRNRKHLAHVINNLRQAGFWWVGSDFDLQGTVDVATKYLEKNREKMSENDIEILTQGTHIAKTALGSVSWVNFKKMHELGVFVAGFPSEARDFWALDPTQAQREPLLLGISQARLAQQFVTKHLQLWDPAEGLAGAGIKIRNELANRDGFDSSTAAPRKTTPESPVKRKSAKQTFTKGFYKELSPDSPLMGTKLVGTASAKLTYLLDQVQKHHKAEKIIIFYDNNNSAYWIAEGMELLGIDFRIYANTLKPALREEYLTLFRESEQVRVLLMDLRQASHGLHIAHASRVYIVNPIWQPNIESQAIKRAHRIGQTRPVFVETLVLQDTLEDKILRRRKAMSDTEIQNDLLDDSTMSSIIQHERFIPMSCFEDSISLAFLRHPAGFFDRHRLPIPDSAEPEITIPQTPKTLVKRKRGGGISSGAVGSESSSSSPKRKRPPPLLQFRDAHGIIMDSPQRSVSPAARRGRGKDRKCKASAMGKTSIIALSGPSSSGKTTLARLLQRIFAHLDIGSDDGTQAQAPRISTFIIHEDDFYHPDDKIPYTTAKSGARIQDWDCVEALDTTFLSASLRYVHEHGHLPPRLKSKEDLNDVSPNSGVDDALIEELKGIVRDKLSGLGPRLPAGEGKRTLAILEGFLLFAPPVASGDKDNTGHPLRPVHDQIDVHLFLPAPYDSVKERREKRSGYVTIGPAPTPDLPQRSSVSEPGEDEKKELDLEAEDDRPPQNFWTDPPGYVDDIVWPRYVRDHAWLLLAENEGKGSDSLVSIRDDDELIKKVGQGVMLRTDAGITVAPGHGSLPMAHLLRWAVEEVLKHLQE